MMPFAAACTAVFVGFMLFVIVAVASASRKEGRAQRHELDRRLADADDIRHAQLARTARIEALAHALQAVSATFDDISHLSSAEDKERQQHKLQSHARILVALDNACMDWADDPSNLRKV